MSSFQLYLLTRLDSIHFFLFFSTSIFSVLSLFTLVGWAMNAADYPPNKKDAQTCKKLSVKSLLALFISGILLILFPTTKEAAFIIVAPKLYTAIQENKELQKIPTKLVDLANEWIEELGPKKEEKK